MRPEFMQWKTTKQDKAARERENINRKLRFTTKRPSKLENIRITAPGTNIISITRTK
jgi:hypothetical protein